MDERPEDPKEALSRLFGDSDEVTDRTPSPFGERAAEVGPLYRLGGAITRLRILRSQAGSDGLTPAATRSLVDEVVLALEAIRDALPSDEATPDETPSEHDR